MAEVESPVTRKGSKVGSGQPIGPGARSSPFTWRWRTDRQRSSAAISRVQARRTSVAVLISDGDRP
jgi:hypothetical protein